MKIREKELKGGPLNGKWIEATNNLTYLDSNGDPVSKVRGDYIKRTGKGGLYYNRGAYFEWNNR